MFQYAAELIRVIDGDTLVVNVDLGFYIKQEMKLRLRNIDTPELNSKERAKALDVKNFVEEQLKNNALAVQTYKIEKWGRFLAEVYFGPPEYTIYELFEKGTNLNQLLIEQGHARPYEEK